jgi:hypothetical protein
MSKSSRNQQCCLHFQLFLEQPIQQIFDIIKDINQHEKISVFLIMAEKCKQYNVSNMCSLYLRYSSYNCHEARVRYDADAEQKLYILPRDQAKNDLQITNKFKQLPISIHHITIHI